MKKVIGLLGKAGSGKSTAAGLLRDEYGAEVLSIARPVKLIAIDVFGFTPEQVFGDAIIKETVDERWGVTPRKVLQDIAEAGRKHIGKDVWILGILKHIRESDNALFVIEDMRYEIEANLIGGLNFASDQPIGGYVFRLTCEDSISTDDGTHPTEAEVDFVDPSLITEDILSYRTPGATHLKEQIRLALETIDVAPVAQQESATLTR